MRKTTTTTYCETCKSEMQLPLWLSKTQRFCSCRCRAKNKSDKSKLKNTVNCLVCKNDFIKLSKSKGFCSLSCYWKSQIVKGDKPKCLDCFKKLSAHKCIRCSSCLAKFHTGERHHNWIQDRTKLKDDSKERWGQLHKEWSKNVKNRDGWKCKISDGDCSGRLESHHILGWSEHPNLRYEINNGITLCQAHHPRKRAEEKRLSPYFMELVSVSK